MESEKLPKRYFTKGKRKFVGFRLPTELSEELNKLAEELGWNVTDVAQTALDHYVHNAKGEGKGAKNIKTKNGGPNE